MVHSIFSHIFSLSISFLPLHYWPTGEHHFQNLMGWLWNGKIPTWRCVGRWFGCNHSPQPNTWYINGFINLYIFLLKLEFDVLFYDRHRILHFVIVEITNNKLLTKSVLYRILGFQHNPMVLINIKYRVRPYHLRWTYHLRCVHDICSYHIFLFASIVVKSKVHPKD